MISFVIPLYNEKENIPLFYAKLKEAIKNLHQKYEVIFIDDGSTDKSFQELQNLRKKEKDLKIIQFRKNFGKAAALLAGFTFAKGEIIVTMDADLQDDPSQVGLFLSKIQDGYDWVCGWRHFRRDPWTKWLPSRIFNLLCSLLTGVRLHDINCGFKAYRREALKEIPLYGGLYRYIPILLYSKGFKGVEIKIKHNPRLHGKSKYGAERFVKGFLDLLTVILLTKFAKEPLHFFGSVGILLGISGFLINLYLTFLWFSGEKIGHRPLLMLGVLLIIIGGQFISMGLIGEMVINVLKREEFYTIKNVIGFKNLKNKQ